MIIDTHAHYDDIAFDEDRESILDKLKEDYIIVNIASDKKSIYKTIELVNNNKNFYGALGIHPYSVDEYESSKRSILDNLLLEKIVAIGEIGLDYHYENIDKEYQKYVFCDQLSLAEKYKKPVVIHSRDACNDTINILSKYNLKGIIHCFSYSKEIAREYVKLGYFIGIGGVLTFKNAKLIKEVVKDISLENMVLETDAPYLTPTPYRGKRNESIYLEYVIDEISKIKGIEYDIVLEKLNKNAQKIYRINI